MTSRRSLFQAFFCATACAAMEVCGLKPSVKAETVVFIPGEYVGEMHWVNLLQDRYPYEFYAKYGHKIILKDESQI